MNNIKQLFSVIEYRGCEIECVVFVGILEACHEWMSQNTCEHPSNNYIHVHNEMYVNGNGELLSYYISELSYYISDSEM